LPSGIFFLGLPANGKSSMGCVLVSCWLICIRRYIEVWAEDSGLSASLERIEFKST
jgi:hypothetical protein